MSVRSAGDVIAARNADSAGALIGYLPIGFPTVNESVEAAIALVENGVDVLELGLPYSDPVMDGPVIQAATERALAQGFQVSQAFDAIARITAAVDAPVLVMTYYNLVLQHGVDRFADDLVAAGGSGLITPDLIPDEASDWIAASERTGLDRVFLGAPTSTDARLRTVVESSRGFVYAVSTMGITGTRTDVDDAARNLVARLHAAGAPAACVGVGISNATHVAEVLEYAEGAIVGSALVKALGDGGVAGVAALAAELAKGAR